MRGYAAAVVDDLADLGGTSAGDVDAGKVLAAVTEIAGELGALVRALESSAALWRVMCQAGYPVQVRAGVMGDLLRAPARADTSRLAQFAVRRERASDLLSALAGLVDILDVEAAKIAASGISSSAGAGEPLASRTASRERLGAYLVGTLQSMEGRAQLEELEDELFRFARVVESDAPLRALLTDRDAPVSARLGVVSDLLSGRASPAGLRMVAYAVRGGRARELVGSLDWLASQVAWERGRRLARVRSAIDLDAGQRREMSLALSARIGTPVELQVEIDRALVGGAVALVGDMVVDGSVRRRLGQLEDALKRGGELGSILGRTTTGPPPSEPSSGPESHRGSAASSGPEPGSRPGDEPAG